MQKLTENHFSFKCPMNWDEMSSTERGKFCGKCRKEVFDLTNCSVDEVIALQKKHGPICGSIKVAAVAISLSAAACHEPNPPRTTGTPVSNHEMKNSSSDVMLGTICLPDRMQETKGVDPR